MIALLLQISVFAQGTLWSHQSVSVDYEYSECNFLTPNELYPGLLAGALGLAPAGVYVSVGSERGFIGASLSPDVTNLVLTDMSPCIVGFNIMNSLLLRAATDRIHYLNLRTKPFRQDWIQAIEQSDLNPQERQYLLNYFPTWLKQRFRFGEFHRRPIKQSDAFFGANYLHDDILFGRVHKFAQAKAIKVYLSNLRKRADVDMVVGDIDQAGLKIAVFDVSNAWWSDYIPRRAMAYLLNKISAIALPNSVFVTSGFRRSSKVADPEARVELLNPAISPFLFSTFDFSFIRDFKNMSRFVKRLPDSFTPTQMVQSEPRAGHNNISINCIDLLFKFIGN